MDADLQDLYDDEGGDFYDTPKVRSQDFKLITILSISIIAE